MSRNLPSPDENREWDSFLCYHPDEYSNIVLFLKTTGHDPIVKYLLFTLRPSRYGQAGHIFEGAETVDVSRAALVEAPARSIVCTVGAFAKMPVAVTLERQYTDPAGVPEAKLIYCQPDANFQSIGGPDLVE